MRLAPTPAGRARGGLRLRAEDAEDLAVISACLQDALVAVRDLAYDRDARMFLMIANRFRWEATVSDGGVEAALERTLCGVAFDNVDDVAYRGFQRSDGDRILSLLAIRPAATARPERPGDAAHDRKGAVIDLEFAAGAAIRLSAAAIRCRASDVGEPWPTSWQPNHPDTTP